MTAHPIVCEETVREQIGFVKNNASVVDNMLKSALIVWSSTGYGLASRIILSFCGGANTIDVLYFWKAAKKRRSAKVITVDTALPVMLNQFSPHLKYGKFPVSTDLRKNGSNAFNHPLVSHYNTLQCLV